MKILFVMTSLKTGGIVTSLVSLLKEIKRTAPETEIDLLLFDISGMRNDLPEGVNVIPGSKLSSLINISFRDIKRKSKLLYVIRVLMVGWTRLFGDMIPYKIICKSNKRLSGYDVAVSCTQSAPRNKFYGCCNEFVLSRVSAEQKISYIHCDYVKYGLNTPYSKKLYEQFDKIAVVSESSKELFTSKVPSVRERTYTVYNCHSYDHIRKLAQNSNHEVNKSQMNFVTVARLGEEKGHLRTIKALHKLKEEGFSFVWHVIGDGNPSIKEQLVQYIEENNMNEEVIMYGDLKNPYSVLIQSSALLLTSYHECAPMVFNEAYALGVPVLSTETLSAHEMVDEKGYGIVCENNYDGIYKMLKQIMLHPEQLIKFRENITSQFNCSNEKAIEQFWRMIYGKNAR